MVKQLNAKQLETGGAPRYAAKTGIGHRTETEIVTVMRTNQQLDFNRQKWDL